MSESTGPAGYTASSWTCSNGDNDGTINVALGDDITCSIINDDIAPTLKLVKNVTKDNGGTAVAGDWDLTATGDSGFTDAGNSTIFHTVKAGVEYTLSESTVTGYSAGSWSCDGGTLNADKLTLGLNQNVTCQITNNDTPPSLTLVKTVSNTHGGNAVATNWTLTADGPTPISGAGGATSDSSFAAGTYTLSETTGPSGYDAGNWSCAKNNNAPVTGSSITLTNGDSATCTITNHDKTARIILIKDVIKDNGGTAGSDDFGISVGGFPVLSGQITDVNANTPYTLNETGHSGYSFVSLTGDAKCPSVLGGTVTLDEGESVTCTITNNDNAPSLTLVKVVDNDFGGTASESSWTLTATGPTGFSGAGPSVSNGASFDAGTYNLSESAALPGYTNGTKWDCVGGGTQNDPDTITLGLGQSATCTITNNDQAGHLIVNKTTIPSDTTNEFSITASGGTIVNPAATQTIVGGGTVNYTVNAGTYNVSEAAELGWDQTGNTCVNVVVANGETEECTITNTKRAHIIIVKDVIGNPDPTDFTFNNNFSNGNPATFLLDEDNNGTLPSSRDFEVLPGTYEVSEVPVADWQSPESTSCTNDETIDSIDVAPGETVTCTFVNEELVEIVLIKNTIGGDGSFDFDATGTGLPADIDLTTVNATATQTFTGLDQDNTYSITENVPAGWDLTSAVCTGGNTPASITPEPDETVTCTFTNTKRGSVVVTKFLDENANGVWDDGEDVLGGWDINLTDDEEYEGNQTTENDGPSFGTTTFENLVPGQYDLSENFPETGNWNQSAIYCENDERTNGVNGNSHPLNVDAGETVSCYIGNYQDGRIIVIKDVVKANGDTLEDTSGDEFDFEIQGVASFPLTDGDSETYDVTPGTYDVTESLNEDYDFGGCSAEYDGPETGEPINEQETQGETVTLGSGDEVTVTCVNKQKPASLTIVKDAQPDSGQLFDFTTDSDSGTALSNFSLKDDGDSSNSETFNDLNGGTYNIDEETVPGWDLTDAICTVNDEDYDFDPRDGSFEVNNGDEIYCTFTNTKRGEIIVTKYQDNNENGVRDENEPTLEGWLMHLSQGEDFSDNETTNTLGIATFENLLTGTYILSEPERDGWDLTNIACSNEQQEGNDRSNKHSVSVSSGETVTCEVGNHSTTPILTISKTNNTGGADKAPGDVVGYTITVEADEEGGPAENVTVTDLLPQGFVFNSSSWKVVSSDLSRGVSGDITSLLTAPTYASPGTWSLGYMNSGETLTLTYTATIDGSQQTGTYYDNAWGQGTAVGSSTVIFARAINPGDLDAADPSEFVGTQVSIVNPNQPGVDYKATSTKEVLGASTFLPATGENTIWVIIATLLGLSGLGTLAFGIRLRRKNEK